MRSKRCVRLVVMKEKLSDCHELVFLFASGVVVPDFRHGADSGVAMRLRQDAARCQTARQGAESARSLSCVRDIKMEAPVRL